MDMKRSECCHYEFYSKIYAKVVPFVCRYTEPYDINGLVDEPGGEQNHDLETQSDKLSSHETDCH